MESKNMYQFAAVERGSLAMNIIMNAGSPYASKKEQQLMCQKMHGHK